MIGIVYNPHTNKGASVERMKKIREDLESRGVQYEYRESTYAGESIALANDLAKTCDVIVAAGGDGTFYEVLNGTIDKDVTYGVLPFGSGNDTSRTLNLKEKSDKELVDVILGENTRMMDVEMFNDDKVSMQFIAMGIVPEVLANFEGMKKVRKINYVMALLNAVRKHKPKNYKVMVDGVEQEYFSDMIAVMNIQTAGGGLRICPEACIDDRKLDLVIIKHVSKRRYFLNLKALATGKLTSQPNVIHRTIDSTTFTANSVEGCVIDGEMFKFDKIKVDIYPKQIRVKV